jgi:hypothetical protein
MSRLMDKVCTFRHLHHPPTSFRSSFGIKYHICPAAHSYQRNPQMVILYDYSYTQTVLLLLPNTPSITNRSSSTHFPPMCFLKMQVAQNLAETCKPIRANSTRKPLKKKPSHPFIQTACYAPCSQASRQILPCFLPNKFSLLLWPLFSLSFFCPPPPKR